MCHFIKLVLPSQADVPALRKIVKRHGRVLEPISEARVDRELAPGDQAFLTTGRCDCGTGLANRKSKRREHDEDREVARLRREGWSEAKIQRWREQRGEAVARKAQAKAKSRGQEVDDWRALVSDLLDAKVDHVGLLVHWITDDIRRGPVLSRESLTPEIVGSLHEPLADVGPTHNPDLEPELADLDQHLRRQLDGDRAAAREP